MKANESRDPRQSQEKMIQSKFHYEENPSKIREARVAKKISQDEMAAKLDYCSTTYGDIERGRRPVRVETAERIAKILHRGVDALFLKKGKKLLARGKLAA